MTDIAAAIGLAQLNKIDEFNSKRIANANYLNKSLKDVKGINIPYLEDNYKHVYHQYTILVENENRDEWVDFLNKKGIGTGIHYPIPLYNQPLYKNLDLKGNCPISEKAANNVISLPVHPSLSENDLDLIIKAVKEASYNFS
jgi:dTDP-4-amino-4,6-dideoxygalactose transaminase